MEQFLEGIAPLRDWYFNPNEKSNKYKSSLLSLSKWFFSISRLIVRKSQLEAPLKSEENIWVLGLICISIRDDDSSSKLRIGCQ